MGLRFGSVCSGIESASVAWEPMGWRASFLSEIEPFPRSVLAHHYPDVPLHGDFTTIKKGQYDGINVLVGGTPCQSFSVAGLRKGLDDPRGNLMLGYLALADKYRPEWLVWENVPGVLSSNGGRDFGTFLGGLGQLGYGFAYRVLDAQHFGVPQRRRRVFVVGCLGDWRRAAAVLFERHSMQGHPAPKRQTGQNITGAITRSAFSGSASGRPEGAAAGHFLPVAYGGNNQSGPIDVATARNACASASGRMDFETETFLVQPVSVTLTASYGEQSGRDLAEMPGGLQVVSALAFDCKASGMAGFGVGDVSSTMRAMGHSNSHQNGGGHLAVCVTGDITHTLKAEGFDASEDGTGRGQPIVAAFAENSRGELRYEGGDGERTGTLSTGGGKPGQGSPAVQVGMAVRRLTPLECERLQGFPDGHTLVPHRGKPAADGPRYKALGNSMAVPVMAWIGRRIEAVSGIKQQAEAA